MDMFRKLLTDIVARNGVTITFSNLKLSGEESVELKSFHALQEIRRILSEERYSDFDCIEKIVQLLEENGIDGGGRHDFG